MRIPPNGGNGVPPNGGNDVPSCVGNGIPANGGRGIPSYGGNGVIGRCGWRRTTQMAVMAYPQQRSLPSNAVFRYPPWVMESFKSGAVRDSSKGRGRYDLIPPALLRRVAAVSEIGAERYGDRNWEAGIPTGRLLESALRHLTAYMDECLRARNGLPAGSAEDHLAHAVWNLAAIMQMEETRPEMDNLRASSASLGSGSSPRNATRRRSSRP